MKKIVFFENFSKNANLILIKNINNLGIHRALNPTKKRYIINYIKVIFSEILTIFRNRVLVEKTCTRNWRRGKIK